MMKKLTELQVLKALDILNFPDIPENRADLQRVSKELQYDTTSTERPCVGYPDCDGDLPGEEHSTGCLAAHNLAERAMSAFLQADHLRPEEAGRSRKAVDAVICLVQQDSNARWEKALRDHPGPAISEQAIECVRARIEANPKTLAERIAELEHQLAEEKKDFDALDDQYHRLGEKYEEIQKIAPQSNKENSMPVGKPMDICPSCRAWIFLGAHHAEGCTRFQSKRTLENERQLAIADARALTLNADFGKMNDLLGSLEWQLITPQNLPKVGDEVGRQDKMSVFADGSFQNILRAVSAYTQSNTAEEWHRLGYHYFRAINLPAHTPEAADALWQDQGTLDYSREHVHLVVAMMKRHK